MSTEAWILLGAAVWAAAGFFAVTVGTPAWMKHDDQIEYQIMRVVIAPTAGGLLLLAWALNFDGMREADWR